MQAEREEILQSEGDQQSEISLARRKPQDCDSVEQQSSAQDPGAHSQPKDVTSKESFDKVKIRLSEINKHVSDGINKVRDTFQHAISIIEKGTAKNLAFLQKEIDTRNPNSIRTALIRRKTSRSRAFSEQC